MRFRQVHLDFHTSGEIDGIGKAFSKEQFQSMLQKGDVESITVFSKCHHGWAYHPSKANEIHPGLKFDLLGSMIEAAHEINVKTPVYLSVGFDEKLARRHPEWLIRNKDDETHWAKGFMVPGFHEFCLNTPYLDILLEQVKEVVTDYDLDGLFLDIVGVRTCYCQHCVAELRQNGKDPRDVQAIKSLGEKTYKNYTEKIKELVHSVKPGLPIFHNGGHIHRGRRDLAFMNTHLELESLPTGGWGYDHFPLSARYAQGLGMEYLGMTGKFHTSWGEFGGYKHPNALRYETALSLANGAKCSVGDQLHPEGFMDELTYSLIGTAYQEVKQKEPWCQQVENIADVALLSLESVSSLRNTGEPRTAGSDPGAIRILLEGKILYDVIDTDSDFSRYKVLILPDGIQMVEPLLDKINHFLSAGGKVLATGKSGLNSEGNAFSLDLGIKWEGENPYRPDFFRPLFKPDHLDQASFICYSQGQKISLQGGQVLGYREDPYFNREVFTFCSHQHTPSTHVTSGPGMVESQNGIYIAWNIFEDYATKGSLISRETVLYAIRRLLPSRTLETDLPAQGVVTLQYQKEHNRFINHLLYASPVKRGNGVEVIEDIIPIQKVEVKLRLSVSAKKVYLAPKGTEIPFQQTHDELIYTISPLECHQMVVIDTA